MKRLLVVVVLVALAVALLRTEPADGPGYVCDPAYSESCP